jgi:hypothetical protein
MIYIFKYFLLLVLYNHHENLHKYKIFQNPQYCAGLSTSTIYNLRRCFDPPISPKLVNIVFTVGNYIRVR